MSRQLLLFGFKSQKPSAVQTEPRTAELGYTPSTSNTLQAPRHIDMNNMNNRAKRMPPEYQCRHYESMSSKRSESCFKQGCIFIQPFASNVQLQGNACSFLTQQVDTCHGKVEWRRRLNFPFHHLLVGDACKTLGCPAHETSNRHVKQGCPVKLEIHAQPTHTCSRAFALSVMYRTDPDLAFSTFAAAFGSVAFWCSRS